MDTFLGLDYPTLWFLAVGGMFTIYAILDGFDFGAGAWHLLLGGNKQRRIALNAIGPVLDGNEVWLVIGGGSLFAGFPVMYGTLLSSMYIPFILFLVFIIFRAVAIEFRGKEKMSWWQNSWDVIYSGANIVLAFLLGVVLGNVLQGIPLGSNFEYQGNGFFDFLNVYSLMVGLSTLLLLMSHGAIYLLIKTEGQLYDRLTYLLKRVIILFNFAFAATSLYTFLYIPHILHLFKEYPILYLVPMAAFLCIANIPRLASKKKYLLAFLFSTLTICLLMVIVALNLYPTLLISTLGDRYNVTIYNAASSVKTLKIMLTMVVIGTPLVVSYTLFAYRTFRGKVKLDESSY